MSQTATRPRSVFARVLFETFRVGVIAGLTAGVGAASGLITINKSGVTVATVAATPTAPGSEAAPVLASGGLVPLDPILVNLAGDSQGFLRASLSVMFAQPSHAQQVQASAIDRTRLRAAVVEVLAGRTAASVASAEGRDDLKRVLRERVGSTLPNTVIADVLFTDFVVQY